VDHEPAIIRHRYREAVVGVEDPTVLL